MTESRSVCSRIRNARASLDNAERSFRSNQEVRGELDLMLAEAELENLRQKRSGISWTRHTLAICFAVLILASGCLGWWWASAYGGNTTSAAGLREQPLTEAKKDITANPAKSAAVPQHNSAYPASVSEKKPVTTERAASSAPVAESKQKETGSRDTGIRLSAGQMRQLIRSGKQELETMR